MTDHEQRFLTQSAMSGSLQEHGPEKFEDAPDAVVNPRNVAEDVVFSEGHTWGDPIVHHHFGVRSWVTDTYFGDLCADVILTHKTRVPHSGEFAVKCDGRAELNERRYRRNGPQSPMLVVVVDCYKTPERVSPGREPRQNFGGVTDPGRAFREERPSELLKVLPRPKDVVLCVRLKPLDECDMVRVEVGDLIPSPYSGLRRDWELRVVEWFSGVTVEFEVPLGKLPHRVVQGRPEIEGSLGGKSSPADGIARSRPDADDDGARVRVEMLDKGVGVCLDGPRVDLSFEYMEVFTGPFGPQERPPQCVRHDRPKWLTS